MLLMELPQMKRGLNTFAMSVAVSMTVAGSAFAATKPTTATKPTPVPLTITVYDQPDFKGSKVNIALPTPDMKALNFDDKVASLTIQGAGDWVLCENRNYTGRCARVQAQAVNLKLQQLNGRVSSLYPVPAPTVPTTPSTSR
jgi:hypothetical protein